MLILIPLAPHEIVSPKTLASIAQQTVACLPIMISTPLDNGERENEIRNRNLLLRLAEAIAGSSDKYACYLDSDVQFATPHDIEDCCAWLDANAEYDAVALDTKGVNTKHMEKRQHVCIACMVIRIERWRGYKFTAGHDACCCIDVNKQFRLRYLDNRVLKELNR